MSGRPSGLQGHSCPAIRLGLACIPPHLVLRGMAVRRRAGLPFRQVLAVCQVGLLGLPHWADQAHPWARRDSGLCPVVVPAGFADPPFRLGYRLVLPVPALREDLLRRFRTAEPGRSSVDPVADA